MFVLLTFLLLMFLVSTGLFRFRWHLRLLLYETLRGQGKLLRRHLQQGQSMILHVTLILGLWNWEMSMRARDRVRQFVPSSIILPV